MKASLPIAFCFVLLAASSGNLGAGEGMVWPRTVSEAARLLRQSLSAKDVDWIRRNPKDVVTVRLYGSLGMGAVNDFGLAGGQNRALLKSCGTNNGEDCSGVIFSALWDQVRADVDPALQKSLDCHFATMERIKIDTTGWYKLRLGELLVDLQRQIDEQDKAPVGAGCHEQLKIVVRGDPNLQCFVRAEFEEKESLTRALEWIDFRNAFTVDNHPPDVELTFNRKCAWPERPWYFAPKNMQQG